MAASQVVISAYIRLYSKSQLEAALRIALHDRASGVVMTQVNFQDGGGSGTPIVGDPNEVIEILELALRQIEGGSTQPKPMMAAVQFNRRRSET